MQIGGRQSPTSTRLTFAADVAQLPIFGRTVQPNAPPRDGTTWAIRVSGDVGGSRPGDTLRRSLGTVVRQTRAEVIGLSSSSTDTGAGGIVRPPFQTGRLEFGQPMRSTVDVILGSRAPNQDGHRRRRLATDAPRSPTVRDSARPRNGSRNTSNEQSATRKGQNGNSVEDLRRPAPEPIQPRDVRSSECRRPQKERNPCWTGWRDVPLGSRSW